VLNRRQLLSLAVALPAMAAPEPARHNIRVAISESLFGDVNQNDARAAMSVWIRRLKEQLFLPADLEADLFVTFPSISAQLRSGIAQSVAISAVEYWKLRPLLDPTTVVVAEHQEEPRYLLISRRGKGVESLADLMGKRLLVQSNPQTCLAAPWLHILTQPLRQRTAGKFFGEVSLWKRPQQVVLPVYFGQADCGLVLESAMQSLTELNPKLSRDLLIVATSPPLEPGAYAFGVACPRAYRDALANALAALSAHESGKLVLSLFQVRGFRQQHTSVLNGAMKLIDEAVRLGWTDEAGILKEGSA
jgi:phosphonate transport system substrate-binding protein